MNSSCAFDKPVLHQRLQCSMASRANIAEQEIISCQDFACATRCRTYFKHVISRGQFLNRGTIHLPTTSYAQLTRFQLGAILGLNAIWEQSGREPLNDINKIVKWAFDNYDSFASLPYDSIMREIAVARLRPKRTKPH